MMIAIDILDWIGRITSLIFIITLILGVVAWFRGILPALIRLGNGLSRRKIVIFAKGDHLRSLEASLLDSKLFDKKNVIDISDLSDFGRAEQGTLFLVYWDDWQDKITEILKRKKDFTAMIVYAPIMNSIPRDKMEELNNERNVVVANLRGRLLNDIVSSLITTSYQ